MTNESNLRAALDVAHDLAVEALNAAEVYKQYPVSGLGRRYVGAQEDLATIKAALESLATLTAAAPTEAMNEVLAKHFANDPANAVRAHAALTEILASTPQQAPAAQGAEPAGWQMRTRFRDREWSKWSECADRDPNEPLEMTTGPLTLQFRPVYTAPPAQAGDQDALWLDWLEADMKLAEEGVGIEFIDGLFRFPYLASNVGGFGGGVGEAAFPSLRAAIDAAMAKGSAS